MMSRSDSLIKVEGVSKKFCRSLKRSLFYGLHDIGVEMMGRNKLAEPRLRKDEFWAVRDVGFELRRGECLGVIGHNGAGKTTLLRMLNGLVKPDAGRIEMRGRVSALIALGAGFNPVLTGRENIYVSASILGMKARQIRSMENEIIEFAELEDFIDTPVQSYSSGMTMRLGFSIATSLKPDILLLDEILAVGDAGFKVKAYARIGEILQSSAVIFVTHSLTQLYRICDFVAVMDRGELGISDSINEAVHRYHKTPKGSEIEAIEYTHSSIKSLKYDYSKMVKNDAEWLLKIYAFSDIALCVGLVIVNFSNPEGLLVAEYRQSFEPGNLNLKEGKNEISIYLESVPLKGGNYHIDFALYSHDGKNSLVHVSHAPPIRVLSEMQTEAVAVLRGQALDVIVSKK